MGGTIATLHPEVAEGKRGVKWFPRLCDMFFVSTEIN